MSSVHERYLKDSHALWDLEAILGTFRQGRGLGVQSLARVWNMDEADARERIEMFRKDNLVEARVETEWYLLLRKRRVEVFGISRDGVALLKENTLALIKTTENIMSNPLAVAFSGFLGRRERELEQYRRKEAKLDKLLSGKAQKR